MGVCWGGGGGGAGYVISMVLEYFQKFLDKPMQREIVGGGGWLCNFHGPGIFSKIS